MNGEQYQPALDLIDLVGELKRLLVSQRQADRLICRYLADLADKMANCPVLALVYGDVYQFVRAGFGLSLRSIRERIRVGKALRALPLLDAALTSGELTYSRMREVTRVATAESEGLWLEAARRLSMRSLELRVAEASGKSRLHEQRAGARIRPANPMLNLPTGVLQLLHQAMRAVRAGCEQELTDAQALAAVARAALTHLAGRPSAASSVENATHLGSLSQGTERVNEPTDDSTVLETSQGGSWEDGSWEDGSWEGGSWEDGASGRVAGIRSEGGGPRSTHCGSPEAGAGEGAARTQRERDDEDAPRTSRGKPLTPDARLLFDLIRSGGYWNAATLGQATRMPAERLIAGLFDLETGHLVTRGVFGEFEVAAGRYRQAG